MRFSRAQTVSRPLDGGLNTEFSPVDVPPGMFISGFNHELADPKGYGRIAGYERVDGRVKASAARYTILRGTYVFAVAKGSNFTTGGKQFVVLESYNAASPYLAVYMITGELVPGDSIPPMSNITSVSVGSGVANIDDDTRLNIEARKVARGEIGKLPGDGQATGCMKLNGVLYGFRDNGANNYIFKSTAAGWVPLDLGIEMNFNAGAWAVANVKPKAGNIVSNGTVTATVVSFQLISGSWGGADAYGHLVLKNQTGSFSAGDTLTFSSAGNTTATATASSASAAVTRKAGGKIKGFTYNFTGFVNDISLYGCDGVNKAFKIDQNGNFTHIYTGMEPSGIAPEVIMPHHHHLFLSYISSWMVSDIGTPLGKWSSITGATEFGTGDLIVGATVTPNGTMVSFCENKIDVIYGSAVNGSDPFIIKPYSTTYGAFRNSVQNTLGPTYVNGGGLTVMTTTQKWGDFEANDVDIAVKTIVDSIKGNISCSCVFEKKNEYRVYSGSLCLRMKLAGGKIRGFTQDVYDKTIFNIWADARSVADDVYFVSDDGFVYQMDSGVSFDGRPIPAFMTLAPDHLGSIRTKKKWYTTFIEMISSGGKSKVYVKNDYSFLKPTRYDKPNDEIFTSISAGRWDVSKWRQAVWGDKGADNYYKLRDHGSSPAIQTSFFSENTEEARYIIKIINRRFAVRGQVR